MSFKAYGKKVSSPSRMTRKRMRRDVFLANKKAAKIARKARRLERRLSEQSEESL